MTGQVHNIPHDHINPDGDGYGPYAIGGQVNQKIGTVAYTDTAAKVLMTLPAGAIITDVMVNVVTAFNSSGTDLLDLGLASSGAALANDLDVSATGQITSGFVPGALHVALDVDTDITATFAQSVADASAGAASIVVSYIIV